MALAKDLQFFRNRFKYPKPSILPLRKRQPILLELHAIVIMLI